MIDRARIWFSGTRRRRSIARNVDFREAARGGGGSPPCVASGRALPNPTQGGKTVIKPLSGDRERGMRETEENNPAGSPLVSTEMSADRFRAVT